MEHFLLMLKAGWACPLPGVLPLSVIITPQASLEGLVMVVAGPSGCKLGRRHFRGQGGHTKEGSSELPCATHTQPLCLMVDGLLSCHRSASVEEGSSERQGEQQEGGFGVCSRGQKRFCIFC
jgi:hypothetical protein